MITQEVREYVKKYQLCSDYIFANWEDFLELLYARGNPVEGILWFEYMRIGEHSHSLGCGGCRG